VTGVALRTVLGFLRHRARREGIPDGRSGAVAIVQRFGGALNLNVHLHTLVLDGVFAVDGSVVVFHHTRRLTREDVAGVVARTALQVERRAAIDVTAAIHPNGPIRSQPGHPAALAVVSRGRRRS